MRIYLAGKYSRRLELLAYAERLEALGHTVTSRWLRFAGEAVDRDLAKPANRQFAAAFAHGDIDDLRAADLFIAFTEEPYAEASRGGRHVEASMALALHKLVRVKTYSMPLRTFNTSPTSTRLCRYLAMQACMR